MKMSDKIKELRDQVEKQQAEIDGLDYAIQRLTEMVAQTKYDYDSFTDALTKKVLAQMLVEGKNYD